MRAVEDAGGFRDALDLVEEAVAFDAVRRILERVLGEHDHEAGGDPRSLAAQDAAHALDHLAPGAARAHDDAEVRVGHVDAFVEHAWRGNRIELPIAEIVEDLAPLSPRGGAGDQVDGTSGSSRLIAWFAARTVSVKTSAPSASLIAGARLPSSSYLPIVCATIWRRFENASR